MTAFIAVQFVLVDVADERDRLAHRQRFAELIERLPAGVAADALRRRGARPQRRVTTVSASS